MRVLRGTLTFILGMIIGIILFVLAIGGAVYIMGTSMTVGELQQKFTDEEILDNFYIGDLLEIDLNVGTAEQYFDDTWNKQTGNGKWGK